MHLESIMAQARPEQVRSTLVDEPGHFKSCYRADGWSWSGWHAAMVAG
jgi:hypothetical protein